MNKISQDCKLTEVQAHADENYQAKPGVEVGNEVNDGNDNISDGGEDAEHYVTGRQRRGNRSNPLSSSIMVRSIQENDILNQRMMVLNVRSGWANISTTVCFGANSCNFK